MKMKMKINVKEQNTFIDKGGCTGLYSILWRY